MLTFHQDPNEALSIKFWPSIFSKTHTHDFWEILFLCNGSLVNILNKKSTEMKKYDIVLIKPSDIHKITPSANDFAEYYNLMIRLDYFIDFCDFIHKNLSNDFIKADNLYTTLSAYNFERCLKIISLANTSSDATEKQKYFHILLSMLLPQFIPLPKEQTNSPVAQTIEIMSNPKHMRLSLKEISQMVGYTPEHLTRLFKKENKNSPSIMFNDFKMQHARTLLLQTDIPIQDIASAIGISSMPHFYQSFKRHYNATPINTRNTRNK